MAIFRRKPPYNGGVECRWDRQTRSLAVAERPRVASCLYVVSFLRQQKTELWPRGLCPGGEVWPPYPAYNVEPVTNASSSSCENNGDGRRRECSAQRRPSRLYFSHFMTRTVYNTIDLYAVYAAIFVQNGVFCLPHLNSTPPLGRFPSEYRHPVWQGKTRRATRWWKNFEDIFSRFGATHKRDRWTDRRTDRHCMPAIDALMHSITWLFYYSLMKTGVCIKTAQWTDVDYVTTC